MSLDHVLPARPGQVCPCGAPAVYGLLWRRPGQRPLLRQALACARCVPPEAASWAPPAVALDPLPPENRSASDLPAPEFTGSAPPPPVDLPSSSGEGDPPERSSGPVEAQAEPPAVAVAESEGAGRGLPAQEPLATAGGQPTSTPTPQETPMPSASFSLPSVDPEAPESRCRLQGCPRAANVRGLCLPHYDRARRHERLDELALPATPRGQRLCSAASGAPASGTEIRRSDPQERDRYAAAEARIASLSAEAIQLRARLEESERAEAAVTAARICLAEILQEPTSTPWGALLERVDGLKHGQSRILTAGELKARAALLQESELLRGWLVGDIAVSVRAPGGDWKNIGGEWLFAAVTAVLQTRADELERRALEGVSRG